MTFLPLIMVVSLVRLFQIYHTELKLKAKHNGGHATFLMQLSVDKDNFIYKMFDKRDAFNFIC